MRGYLEIMGGWAYEAKHIRGVNSEHIADDTSRWPRSQLTDDWREQSFRERAERLCNIVLRRTLLIVMTIYFESKLTSD